MPAVSFSAMPRREPDGALVVEVPERVVDRLGGKRRAPVRVTLNGVGYRSTIAVYGGRFYLPVRREIREAAALAAGQSARVTLEVDADARTIALPADLAAALADSGLEPAFAALSFTHRRELVESVTGAKRAETRRARIAKALMGLRGQGMRGGAVMGEDRIRGKTLRWTFEDGPVAGRAFEHTFNADGTVSYLMAGGASGDKPTTEKKYEVERVSDDVFAVSYLAASGYTLTTVLDFKSGKAVAFASNEKELTVQHGTFETVG